MECMGIAVEEWSRAGAWWWRSAVHSEGREWMSGVVCGHGAGGVQCTVREGSGVYLKLLRHEDNP